MTIKELRKQKLLSQLEVPLICNIPLRSYKRLENESMSIFINRLISTLGSMKK